MSVIKEAELPGLGKKYAVTLENGDQVVIVIHDEGNREVYYFPTGEDDPIASVTMTDQEARQVGSIISGSFYQPRLLEKLETAVAELHIEWLQVEPSSELSGKSIGTLGLRKNLGIIVIAAIEDKHKGRQAKTYINPGPSYVFTPGHTIVVAGTKEKMNEFERLLNNSSKEVDAN
ncbi:cation:proton antiporter regulatory subunit [Desulfoscipio gibsoniae]|uniref:Putative regulatory ligand binding protein, C-terminal domain of K+ channels like protein n=1 Tax=Desulfoscipio gibsoniae DSM 7213 TaxID=767817 RepID=R4KR53_9FIRM|nr:TrkA C-terminal domain-containing protein [Desulfoscipio gibsoniae]AGL03035.1 putative regulatory ligand binding protein, C-terminal domain of K+ channels like protein [Desulfoscipio gibsoniae DSM 7213]